MSLTDDFFRESERVISQFDKPKNKVLDAILRLEGYK